MEVLSVLGELMLADANRLAMIKAQQRGMSSATLLKLGVVVMQAYEQCSSLLKRLPKADAEELADPFTSYVHDGAILIEAQVLKRFAELKHEEGDNGAAVVCITRAHNNLLQCLRAEWPAHKRVAQESLAEYEGLCGPKWCVSIIM